MKIEISKNKNILLDSLGQYVNTTEWLVCPWYFNSRGAPELEGGGKGLSRESGGDVM